MEPPYSPPIGQLLWDDYMSQKRCIGCGRRSIETCEACDQAADGQMVRADMESWVREAVQEVGRDPDEVLRWCMTKSRGTLNPALVKEALEEAE
jgi:hypothetical protein